VFYKKLSKHSKAISADLIQALLDAGVCDSMR
jgi:hypothetical protein